MRDHTVSRLADNEEAPNPVTLNVRRSLSFNGEEVAVVPHSDIAGRYFSAGTNGPTNGQNIKDLTVIEQNESIDAKPIPAPRSLSLVRRPSSAGLQFKKQILSAQDLEPTGPPDRTYKVSI